MNVRSPNLDPRENALAGAEKHENVKSTNSTKNQPKKRFVSRLDRSRIAKGILPRSRKTARVTPQTRAEMSVAFDSLSPEVKLGFIECLWDSLPDKAAVSFNQTLVYRDTVSANPFGF